MPAYEPSGTGDFLYLTIRRASLNTRDVVQSLSTALEVQDSLVGFAGLKDKHAITTQTFSLPLAKLLGAEGTSSEFSTSEFSTIEREVRQRLEDVPDLTLLSLNRHQNSLKRGHLKGNAFSILVRDLRFLQPGTDAELQSELHGAAQRLIQDGMLNLFGSQRFGKEGSTLQQGLSYMQGKKTRKWLLDLGMSAVQSYVFNHYLRIRYERGDLHNLVDGDLAVKSDSGGLFKVPEASAEMDRFKAGEICYTGPMFGRKMRSPEGPSRALEQAALDYAGKTEEDFKALKVSGARRAALVFLHDLKLEWPDQDSVWLHFSLPAGAYATVAMSHLIHLEENSERDI